MSVKETVEKVGVDKLLDELVDGQLRVPDDMELRYQPHIYDRVIKSGLVNQSTRTFLVLLSADLQWYGNLTANGFRSYHGPVFLVIDNDCDEFIERYNEIVGSEEDGEPEA